MIKGISSLKDKLVREDNVPDVLKKGCESLLLGSYLGFIEEIFGESEFSRFLVFSYSLRLVKEKNKWLSYELPCHAISNLASIGIEYNITRGLIKTIRNYT